MNYVDPTEDSYPGRISDHELAPSRTRIWNPPDIEREQRTKRSQHQTGLSGTSGLARNPANREIASSSGHLSTKTFFFTIFFPWKKMLWKQLLSKKLLSQCPVESIITTASSRKHNHQDSFPTKPKWRHTIMPLGPFLKKRIKRKIHILKKLEKIWFN